MWIFCCTYHIALRMWSGEWLIEVLNHPRYCRYRYFSVTWLMPVLFQRSGISDRTVSVDITFGSSSYRKSISINSNIANAGPIGLTPHVIGYQYSDQSHWTEVQAGKPAIISLMRCICGKYLWFSCCWVSVTQFVGVYLIMINNYIYHNNKTNPSEAPSFNYSMCRCTISEDQYTARVIQNISMIPSPFVRHCPTEMDLSVLSHSISYHFSIQSDCSIYKYAHPKKYAHGSRYIFAVCTGDAMMTSSNGNILRVIGTLWHYH